MMPVDNVLIENIYTIGPNEMVLDFEENGDVYLRLIRDGVAYLPGFRMDAVEFYEVATQPQFEVIP